MPYDTILYYTIVHTIVYYTITYYTILHYIILYYTILTMIGSGCCCDQPLTYNPDEMRCAAPAGLAQVSKAKQGNKRRAMGSKDPPAY